MNGPMVLYVDRVDSPVGELLVAADGDGRVAAVCFAPFDEPQALLARVCGSKTVRLEPDHDPGGAVTALRAYFEGDLDAIDGLRVAPVGTSFQQEVWAALRGIPCGTTTSYGALARRLGRPDASRAVGLANGSNPIAIVIPCHRVIGASGALTGYGGGLARKRWLLAHEAKREQPALF